MLQAPVTDKRNKAESINSAMLAEREQQNQAVNWLGQTLQRSTTSVERSFSIGDFGNLAMMQQAYGNQAALRRLRTGKGRSPATNPFKGGVLQRKCACGNSAGSSGSCTECQSKQEHILQTKLQISEPSDLETSIGGEVDENAPRDAGLPGGVETPAPEAPDTSISSQPPSSVALTAHDTFREDLGCGGFNQQIEWRLNNANKNTYGYIVQKVILEQKKRQCTGQDTSFKTVYWEAWKVVEGRPSGFLGWLGIGGFYDTFSSLPSRNHFGTKITEGYAKFIPNYTAPDTWGNVSEAGDLLSTKNEPPGWSDSGTIHRILTAQFDCCDGKSNSEFSHKRV